MGLVDHLHLLLRVTVVQEDVDVREGVQVDGMRVEVAGAAGALGLELVHALGAAAGDALVGAHDDALDAVGLVEGSQGHQHLDGGTVRVRDDVVVGTEDVAVDLGDDELLGRVHPPVGGIVHDTATHGRELRGQFARSGAAGAEDGDGGTLGDGLVGADDRPLTALEGDFLSPGAGRGDGQ